MLVVTQNDLRVFLKSIKQISPSQYTNIDISKVLNIEQLLPVSEDIILSVFCNIDCRWPVTDGQLRCGGGAGQGWPGDGSRYHGVMDCFVWEAGILWGYNLTKHWNILRICEKHVNVSEKISMFS